MSNQHFFKPMRLPFAEGRYSKDSGRHYKPHMHKAFSIGAIDQGEVTYLIDGETVKLQPGGLALINPEILHSCNPAESCERSYYILHLDVDWCLQLQQSLWQLEAFLPVNRVLLDDDSIYQKYVNTMKSLMSRDELLEQEQHLVDLVENIFLQTCEPTTVKNRSSIQIEALKLQLGLNLDKDTTMKALAIELQANPYTLLRQFKAATGITPHAYRLNCRIELARKLLQEGLGLSQVALKCGFYDQSHFHNQFKTMTTVTPKEYQVNFLQ